MSLIADELDEDEGVEALGELRAARRRNRLQQLSKFDAFYKAYVSALFATVAIYAIAGQFGDEPLNHAAVLDVIDYGPAYIGALVAVGVAIGLRSGTRGGPLAFERPDVRYVLLAPVDRRESIRRPAMRQMRHAIFLGGAVGGAAGLIASRRLPEPVGAWAFAGLLFGGAAGVAAYGAAMIAGGYKLKRWVGDLLSLVLLGWSAFDITQQMVTSPFTWLGHVAVWPLHVDLIGLAGIATTLVVGGWGLMVINRCSIEAAERRSRLVGQLRFAATMQDVRTVMVLQRQLAQEHLRQRPWVRLPRKRRSGVDGTRVHGSVFLRRSVQGLLRWPLARIARLVALCAVVGASIVGVWQGTSPLVVVGGLAIWLAAIDLLEPLAQEADRPDRLRTVGMKLGVAYSRHLVMPFFVLALLCTLVIGVPGYFFAESAVVSTLLPLLWIAPACAIGGAALAISRPAGATAGAIDTPEIAGMRAILRLILPPGIAILGLLPIVPARDAWLEFHTSAAMTRQMNFAMVAAMTAASWAVIWIRFGDQLREQITAGMVPDPKKVDAEGQRAPSNPSKKGKKK